MHNSHIIVYHTYIYVCTLQQQVTCRLNPVHWVSLRKLQVKFMLSTVSVSLPQDKQDRDEVHSNSCCRMKGTIVNKTLSPQTHSTHIYLQRYSRRQMAIPNCRGQPKLKPEPKPKLHCYNKHWKNGKETCNINENTLSKVPNKSLSMSPVHYICTSTT